MKTFKEYLLEDGQQPNQELMDGLELISYKCDNFLREFGETPIFRGIGQKSQLFTTNKVRDNRLSRDTNQFTNFVFNVAMESLFKVKMVRKQTLYGTGSESSAKDYGRVNFIFLPNGYSGIYSEKIRDVAHEEGHIERALWQEMTSILGNRDELDDFLEHGDFTISGMNKSFGVKSKEMIKIIVDYFGSRYQNKISEKSRFNEMSFYNVTEYFAIDVELFAEEFGLHDKYKHTYKGNLDESEYYYIELLKMIKDVK